MHVHTYAYNACVSFITLFDCIQVTPNDQLYLQEVESREEGGTPSIVGSIRAGLALQLKQSVGVGNIMKEESKILKYVKLIRTYVCMLYVHVNYCTYSRKFSRDKFWGWLQK